MSAKARRKRLRAPFWLAPILLWYEQTMAGLTDKPKSVEHTGHTRSWWRHFEKAGMAPLRPIVLSQHARARYMERYGADPNHLDLEAFRFTGERSLAGTLIVSDGKVFLAVSREKHRYFARTALTAAMMSFAIAAGHVDRPSSDT